MILLSILMIALILAAAAILVRLIFRPNWAWLDQLIFFVLAFALILGTVCGCMKRDYGREARNLAAEFEEITLYHETVSLSSNEYVRFNFYERVREYNKAYLDTVKESENMFYGALYPKNWAEGLTTIEFMLRENVYAEDQPIG
jgi:hypothetical protein